VPGMRRTSSDGFYSWAALVNDEVGPILVSVRSAVTSGNMKRVGLEPGFEEGALLDVDSSTETT
jgi:hypothetical protein